MSVVQAKAELAGHNRDRVSEPSHGVDQTTATDSHHSHPQPSGR